MPYPHVEVQSAFSAHFKFMNQSVQNVGMDVFFDTGYCKEQHEVSKTWWLVYCKYREWHAHEVGCANDHWCHIIISQYACL